MRRYLRKCWGFERHFTIIPLADAIIGFIFQCGAPEEIRVTNILVEAGLEQIFDVCGIKLRRVKRLKTLE